MLPRIKPIFGTCRQSKGVAKTRQYELVKLLPYVKKKTEEGGQQRRRRETSAGNGEPFFTLRKGYVCNEEARRHLMGGLRPGQST